MSRSLMSWLDHKITATEKHHDHVLTAPDRMLLVTAVHEFVDVAVDKFVRGAKEHGGSLVDRNTLAEAKLEVPDLWFYLVAHQLKLKQL